MRFAAATLALALVLGSSSFASADRIAPPQEPAMSRPPNAGAPLPIMPHQPPSRPVFQPPRATAAPEIAAQARRIAGTYACKGTRMNGNGSSSPMRSTITIKLDLDAAWIATTWREASVKMVDYRTYDASSKQWTRFLLASDSSHATLTSLGDKAGEWQWEGAESSPIGTLQVRHHERVTGKQLALWGEALLGGTWQKTYEASCKR